MLILHNAKLHVQKLYPAHSQMISFPSRTFAQSLTISRTVPMILVPNPQYRFRAALSAHGHRKKNDIML